LDTTAFIHLLAQDAGSRERFGARVAAALAGAVGFVAVAFLLALGRRPDFIAALDTIRFPFKFAVTGALTLGAAAAVLRLGRPETATGRACLPLLAAPLLLGLGVLTELTETPAAAWHALMMGKNAALCLTLIPALSVAPLACLLAALRHGAPTRPGLAGAVAGLAAAGIAASFYAANCTDDSPLFVLAWYPIAIGGVALAGGLIGRRALRW
jgi:hypothetical protein